MPNNNYIVRLTEEDIELIEKFVSCHCDCTDRIHKELCSTINFKVTEKERYDHKTLHEKLTDALWYAARYEKENYDKCFPDG